LIAGFSCLPLLVITGYVLISFSGIGFVGQDCSSGQFDVLGTVHNKDGKPIPSARVTVHVKALGCENSRPSADLTLLSDMQGHFQGVKTGITEGDTFEITVLANDYKTYRKAYGVWEFIRLPESKQLNIVLDKPDDF
jgi:hypothetical protein